MRLYFRIQDNVRDEKNQIEVTSRTDRDIAARIVRMAADREVHTDDLIEKINSFPKLSAKLHEPEELELTSRVEE